MKIGILDDEPAFADKMKSYILEYFDRKGRPVEIFYYTDALSLLENYRADLDVLFMDIQMPGLNGMDAAARIRKFDPHVVIVFVTTLAQYAVDGYVVNAFDFILKPLDYNGFTMKLDRICKEIDHRMDGQFINVKTKTGIIRLKVSDIAYVEVKGHDIIFHTGDENHIARGQLKNIVPELEKYYFALCNSCYLVNLAYVRKVNKTLILSTGDELFVSQGKRKQFMAELAKYMGGTI